MAKIQSPIPDLLPARRPADCVLETWLSFLGHRWNALLLWQLSAGPLRFSDLQAALSGITPKVLTDRLAGLVAHGLLSRETTHSAPREVRYAVTERGRQVAALLQDFYNWAEGDAASHRAGDNARLALRPARRPRTGR